MNTETKNPNLSSTTETETEMYEMLARLEVMLSTALTSSGMAISTKKCFVPGIPDKYALIYHYMFQGSALAYARCFDFGKENEDPAYTSLGQDFISWWSDGNFLTDNWKTIHQNIRKTIRDKALRHLGANWKYAIHFKHNDNSFCSNILNVHPNSDAFDELANMVNNLASLALSKLREIIRNLFISSVEQSESGSQNVLHCVSLKEKDKIGIVKLNEFTRDAYNLPEVYTIVGSINTNLSKKITFELKDKKLYATCDESPFNLLCSKEHKGILIGPEIECIRKLRISLDDLKDIQFLIFLDDIEQKIVMNAIERSLSFYCLYSAVLVRAKITYEKLAKLDPNKFVKVPDSLAKMANNVAHNASRTPESLETKAGMIHGRIIDDHSSGVIIDMNLNEGRNFLKDNLNGWIEQVETTIRDKGNSLNSIQDSNKISYNCPIIFK